MLEEEPQCTATINILLYHIISIKYYEYSRYYTIIILLLLSYTYYDYYRRNNNSSYSMIVGSSSRLIIVELILPSYIYIYTYMPGVLSIPSMIRQLSIQLSCIPLLLLPKGSRDSNTRALMLYYYR